MSDIIKKFKTFEKDSYFGDDDAADVNLDDVEMEEKPSEEGPTSEEDLANKKEFDNLHAAVENILDTTVEENQTQKEELVRKIKDEGIDAANLKTFTNENDIYDFYLEHRLELDEKLSDIDFFDSAPVKYGSRSLYDYVVQGTKIAVESLIVDMG